MEPTLGKPIQQRKGDEVSCGQIGISGVAAALFAASAGGGWALTIALDNRVPLFAGLLIGFYLLASIKVADQWEKVAVLRLRSGGPVEQMQ